VTSGPRAIWLFATLLVVLTGAAFALSSLYSPQRALDLTPAPEYVSAPVPVTAEAPAAAPAPGQLVDQAWLTRTARRTGIPEPALRAYADAQLSEVGGCDLGWTTLAGIGWVESHHGTIDGRTLTADGRSSTPIIGPTLDGKGPVAAIRSTPESAAWHGDQVWEHAVGPLQFLRSSWDAWAADGDSDGIADPHDLDDAAATAARYLCASGQDLDTSGAWASAILSYNHAQEYVDAVHAAASAYADRAAG
jgi:hypothetical protein